MLSGDAFFGSVSFFVHIVGRFTDLPKNTNYEDLQRRSMVASREVLAVFAKGLYQNRGPCFGFF